MKAKVFLTFAFLCAVAQGAWATDYNVGTDSELRSAIQNNDANITVTADIDLSNSTLSIESGTTVTIDLGGHTLDRKLTKRGEGGGQVITVREGATLNLSNGTLKLNFTDATSIQAGKPYIVKWTPGDPLENPVFTNVTIGNTTNNVETDYVDFCGTYVPVGFQADDQTMLYMGTDNKLHYPDDAVTINAFHSYFLLKGLDKSTLPADNIMMTFSMNHGPTGIEMMSDGRGKMSDAWYDLQGRKLNFKPTQKGVYINNGKIRVIK